MKVTGQCHCGAIGYEAEIDPARVSACHCTDCQRLSGSAYRVLRPSPPRITPSQAISAIVYQSCSQ